MYDLCAKYEKPTMVQYYIADCVSWVPRLILLDLGTKWELWTCSQNGTFWYVWDLLYSHLLRVKGCPEKSPPLQSKQVTPPFHLPLQCLELRFRWCLTHPDFHTKPDPAWATSTLLSHASNHDHLPGHMASFPDHSPTHSCLSVSGKWGERPRRWDPAVAGCILEQTPLNDFWRVPQAGGWGSRNEAAVKKWNDHLLLHPYNWVNNENN